MILLYAGFVLTGIVNTVLGPVLPWLTLRWGLTDATAGSLFTIQFAGGLTGGTLSGALASRIGAARTLASGCVLMAVGLVGMAISGREIGSIAVAIAGLGLGFVIPTTNLMSARLTPHRAAAALGAVNLCWGLGAAIWPLIVAAFLNRAGVSAALLTVAAAAIAMAVVFAGASYPPDRVETSGESAAGRRAALGRLALYGTCIALYSGIEAAFGGWITEHARRLHAPGGGGRWEVAASAFWGGLAAGRGLVAVALSRRFEIVSMFGGIAALTLGIAAAITVTSVDAVLIAGVVCGLALAPIFPVTVAALAREFSTRRAGPMVAMGSVGAGVLPLAVGAISARTDSLATGLASLAVGAVVLGGLQWLRTSAGARRAEA
jgi:fucose permease